VLAAEVDGLQALAAAGVRVPHILDFRSEAQGATLTLEWLDLRTPDAGFGTRLGSVLAALHHAGCPMHPPRFGWTRDNFIGATPQPNAWHEDWIAFHRSQRLGAMRDRLLGDAQLADAVASVIERIPLFFDDRYAPRPALIHGDLWSGNWGMLPGGEPVLYDPCVSYSDPEAELAMMELFGGVPPGFWPAYRAAAGVHAGYARRRSLYQLYHLLNHVVLFGASYRQQALQCAQRLLRA
jgi:protein-ribulosamine 3-kinase